MNLFNYTHAIVKSVTSLLWPRLDDGKEPLKHLDLALELAVSLSELRNLLLSSTEPEPTARARRAGEEFY